MVRFIELRGTGKTFRLIQMVCANQGIFVCQNPRWVKKQAEIWGYSKEALDKVVFMSAEAFLEGKHRGFNDKPIFIDDVELILKKIAGEETPLTGYSISIDDGLNIENQYWPLLNPDKNDGGVIE